MIYLLSTRVDLCFTVQKMETFSSNTGKAHIEGLVHLLRYSRDNNNLGLNIMPRYRMHLYLTYLYRPELGMITN